jgi:hypothetical protein
VAGRVVGQHGAALVVAIFTRNVGLVPVRDAGKGKKSGRKHNASQSHDAPPKVDATGYGRGMYSSLDAGGHVAMPP